MGRFIERLKTAKKEKVKWSDCQTARERVVWVVSRVVAALISFGICFLAFALIALVVASIRGCSIQKASAEESLSVSFYKTGSYNSGYFYQSTMQNNIRNVLIPISNDENGYISPIYTNSYHNFAEYTATLQMMYAPVYPSNGGIGVSFVGSSVENRSFYSSSVTLPSQVPQTGVVLYWYGLEFVASYDSSNSRWQFQYDIGEPSFLNVTYHTSYEGFNQFPVGDLTSSLPFIHYEWCWSLADIGVDIVSPIDYLTFNLWVYDTNTYPINKSDFNYSVKLSTYNDFDIYYDGVRFGKSQAENQLTTSAANSISAEAYNSGMQVGYNSGLDLSLSDVTPFQTIAQGITAFFSIEIFPEFPLYIPLLIGFGCLMLTVLIKVFFHG